MPDLLAEQRLFSGGLPARLQAVVVNIVCHFQELKCASLWPSGDSEEVHTTQRRMLKPTPENPLFADSFGIMYNWSTI